MNKRDSINKYSSDIKLKSHNYKWDPINIDNGIGSETLNIGRIYPPKGNLNNLQTYTGTSLTQLNLEEPSNNIDTNYLNESLWHSPSGYEHEAIPLKEDLDIAVKAPTTTEMIQLPDAKYINNGATLNGIQHESAKLGNGRIGEGYFDINKTSINARLESQTTSSLIDVNESLRVDNPNGLIINSCEMLNKHTSSIGVNDFNLTQETLHYESSFLKPTAGHLKEATNTDALLGDSLGRLESIGEVKALEFNSRKAITTRLNTSSLYEETASDMFGVVDIPFMSGTESANVLGKTSKEVSVRASALNGRLNNETWLEEVKKNDSISKRDTILNGPDITTFKNIQQSDSLIGNYKSSYEDVKDFATGKIEEMIKESIDISDDEVSIKSMMRVIEDRKNSGSTTVYVVNLINVEGEVHKNTINLFGRN